MLTIAGAPRKAALRQRKGVFSLKTLQKTARCLYKISYYIMGVTLGIVLLLVFGQIALRYFGVLVPWASEVAQYANVIMVFGGLPAITYRGSHIVMDNLSGKLPDKWKRYYKVFSQLTLLVFYIMAAKGFVTFMPAAKTVSFVSLHWLPMNVIYGACLAGLIAAMICSVVNIIIYLFCGTETVELHDKEVTRE